MKKFFLMLLACALASCNTGNTPSQNELPMKLANGIWITPSTEVVEIEFEAGESPYFDNYMMTGAKTDHIVWFAFYKAYDIEGNMVKKGAIPCRHYQVVLPLNEVAKSWGYGPIKTIRPDGSEHTINIRLVNQPE